MSSKSKSKSEHPGSAYLDLLRHAGLDDFAKLSQHGHAAVQDRIEAANRELKLFERHPDGKIVIHLQGHGERQKAGPVTIAHLPDPESHLWKDDLVFRSDHEEHKDLDMPLGLPGSDDFSLRRPRRIDRGLPGDIDFDLRKPPGGGK